MRRALILVAPVLAIALAGCPSKPKDGECKTSADCEAQEGFGKVCVDGRCQVCAVDTDCKAGFACRQNKCVPKPECSRDGDCPSGKSCEAGKCADPPPPRAECSQDADCPSGRGCEAGKCVYKAAAAPECPADLKYPAVYFAFDQAALTAESRATLEKNADCIRKQATKQIVIEGNCDERGTVEYNLTPWTWGVLRCATWAWRSPHLATWLCCIRRQAGDPPRQWRWIGRGASRAPIRGKRTWGSSVSRRMGSASMSLKGAESA